MSTTTDTHFSNLLQRKRTQPDTQSLRKCDDDFQNNISYEKLIISPLMDVRFQLKNNFIFSGALFLFILFRPLALTFAHYSLDIS